MSLAEIDMALRRMHSLLDDSDTWTDENIAPGGSGSEGASLAPHPPGAAGGVSSGPQQRKASMPGRTPLLQDYRFPLVQDSFASSALLGNTGSSATFGSFAFGSSSFAVPAVDSSGGLRGRPRPSPLSLEQQQHPIVGTTPNRSFTEAPGSSHRQHQQQRKDSVFERLAAGGRSPYQTGFLSHSTSITVQQHRSAAHHDAVGTAAGPSSKSKPHRAASPQTQSHYANIKVPDAITTTKAVSEIETILAASPQPRHSSQSHRSSTSPHHQHQHPHAGAHRGEGTSTEVFDKLYSHAVRMQKKQKEAAAAAAEPEMEAAPLHHHEHHTHHHDPRHAAPRGGAWTQPSPPPQQHAAIPHKKTKPVIPSGSVWDRLAGKKDAQAIAPKDQAAQHQEEPPAAAANTKPPPRVQQRRDIPSKAAPTRSVPAPKKEAVPVATHKTVAANAADRLYHQDKVRRQRLEEAREERRRLELLRPKIRPKQPQQPHRQAAPPKPAPAEPKGAHPAPKQQPAPRPPAAAGSPVVSVPTGEQLRYEIEDEGEGDEESVVLTPKGQHWVRTSTKHAEGEEEKERTEAEETHDEPQRQDEHHEQPFVLQHADEVFGTESDEDDDDAMSHETPEQRVATGRPDDVEAARELRAMMMGSDTEGEEHYYDEDGEDMGPPGGDGATASPSEASQEGEHTKEEDIEGEDVEGEGEDVEADHHQEEAEPEEEFQRPFIPPLRLGTAQYGWRKRR